jgi:ABC-2 type transport system ATP-binding protein
MAVIEVSELTKYYGEVVGIRDVNFTVEQGEVFGFLGPNGAGKTTAIRLLMQLLNPDNGRIALFGMNADKAHKKLRERIGYLPGDFQPYGEMTVERFLKYMAKYRSRPPKLRQQLIEKLNITSQDLSKIIKHLSHGNSQKLGLVFALEHEPDLAILDEPTLGLDPLMQEAFYQILQEFQQKGKTIFLSSHIMPEVQKICQRVAIIRDGELVTVETLENLKRKSRRRLIVKFQKQIDAPKLPGTQLLKQKGNQCIYLIEGNIHSVILSLTKLPIEDFIYPEAELEDIFLDYYQGNIK